ERGARVTWRRRSRRQRSGTQAYGSAWPSPLSDLDLDGQQYPHGHGVVAAPSGLEVPAAHRLDGRLVEIGVAGGLLDEDVAHAAVDQHVDLEHGGALNALAECTRR